MRKALLFLVAVAAAVPAMPADAAIEPLVRASTTGSCPSGYTSYANVQNVDVCVRSFTLKPDVYVSSTGCPTGYVEAGSAVARRWVCVGL